MFKHGVKDPGLVVVEPLQELVKHGVLEGVGCQVQIHGFRGKLEFPGGLIQTSSSKLLTGSVISCCVNKTCTSAI